MIHSIEKVSSRLLSGPPQTVREGPLMAAYRPTQLAVRDPYRPAAFPRSGRSLGVTKHLFAKRVDSEIDRLESYVVGIEQTITPSR